MSHGVEKTTYVEADEKTTKALTFDLLNSLDEKMEDLTKCYHEHLGICDRRFKSLELKKKRDTAIASASGFGGGFVAMAVHYIKSWIER